MEVNILTYINRIINYIYDKELTDFLEFTKENVDPRHHIFSDIMFVKDWLEQQGYGDKND